MRLALLTAMRRGELSGLRWSDIKADRIVLEAQHTKTGAAHEVPLTELMREVLARQPRTSSQVWCFHRAGPTPAFPVGPNS